MTNPKIIEYCIRCGHPKDWHIKDYTGLFRCTGSDVERINDLDVDNRCTCINFVSRTANRIMLVQEEDK